MRYIQHSSTEKAINFSEAERIKEFRCISKVATHRGCCIDSLIAPSCTPFCECTYSSCIHPRSLGVARQAQPGLKNFESALKTREPQPLLSPK